MLVTLALYVVHLSEAGQLYTVRDMANVMVQMELPEVPIGQVQDFFAGQIHHYAACGGTGKSSIYTIDPYQLA